MESNYIPLTCRSPPNHQTPPPPPPPFPLPLCGPGNPQWLFIPIMGKSDSVSILCATTTTSTSTSTSSSSAATAATPPAVPRFNRRIRNVALRRASSKVGDNWPYLLGLWNLYILGGTIPVYVLLSILAQGGLEGVEVEWHMWISNVVATLSSTVGVVAGYALAKWELRTAVRLLKLQAVNVGTPMFVAGWSGYSLVKFSTASFFGQHTWAMICLVLYSLYGLIQSGVWIAISIHALTLSMYLESETTSTERLLAMATNPPLPEEEMDAYNCANPEE